jgi:transcriptional regulator with XRE-family HTH domain
MHTPAEKKAFSERLRASVANARPPITTAAELARQFALRYTGGSITPGAVRKWWNGEVIPTADKLDALASWLKVPAHWLRYGDAPKGKAQAEAMNAEEVMLLQRFRRLSPSRRKVLLQLLHEFERNS